MQKAHDFDKEELETGLDSYNYQSELTDKLKSVTGPFDHSIIEQIVLWKVNRYPILSDKTIELLNQLTSLRQGEHQKGRAVLELLLAKESKGIDLPMASTILRFRNPEVFQIIDRRAYRVLMPTKDKYDVYASTSVAEKINRYFKYLEVMLTFCHQKGIAFSDADRILYQLDKNVNADVRLDGKQKIKKSKPRQGWEQQFQQMHENGDDKLIISDTFEDEV